MNIHMDLLKRYDLEIIKKKSLIHKIRFEKYNEVTDIHKSAPHTFVFIFYLIFWLDDHPIARIIIIDNFQTIHKSPLRHCLVASSQFVSCF